MSEHGSSRVRVDAWLWAVRITKTRSQAATSCRGGHVRVNGASAKAAQLIGPGDEVRVWHHGTLRVLEVVAPLAKRVGAPVAQRAYLDRSPAPPPREVLASVPRRDRGAGRPTKRERRQLDRLRAMPGDELDEG
ncbi:RNA-binding S4 domain-containing protein [Lolliginicoccus levis]|uniref:RNA-binding S4 domain-containing protein n=1 Tax=Lolliginicoccus levis TaxID=2919542 RepID=UPI00241C3947|nr:RNA-binding S4 domain-containing protein [Lolliginicoccus levis]